MTLFQTLHIFLSEKVILSCNFGGKTTARWESYFWVGCFSETLSERVIFCVSLFSVKELKSNGHRLQFDSPVCCHMVVMQTLLLTIVTAHRKLSKHNAFPFKWKSFPHNGTGFSVGWLAQILTWFVTSRVVGLYVVMPCVPTEKTRLYLEHRDESETHPTYDSGSSHMRSAPSAARRLGAWCPLNMWGMLLSVDFESRGSSVFYLFSHAKSSAMTGATDALHPVSYDSKRSHPPFKLRSIRLTEAAWGT